MPDSAITQDRRQAPLDLAASSSWPDLDTSAGPSPDLNADLVPVDLNADLVPVDLNAAASWPPRPGCCCTAC